MRSWSQRKGIDMKLRELADRLHCRLEGDGEIVIAGVNSLERAGPEDLSFAQALELFYRPPRPAMGVHSTAVIAASAKIGPHASIGPYVVVEEDAEIGTRAVLHSHVVVYRGAKIGDDFYAHSHAVVREFCQIGDRVILQNGVVIGADGFGFAKQRDGSHYKMAQ